MISVSLRASVAVAVVLTLSACTRYVDDFRFNLPSSPIRLTTTVALPKGEQGTFLPFQTGAPSGDGTATRETPRYGLVVPYPVEAGQSFYLTYRGSGGALELRVFETDGAGTEVMVKAALPWENPPALIGASNTRTLLVPLRAGVRVAGFQVLGAASSGVRILGAGVRDAYPGFKIDGDGLVVQRGVTLSGSVSSDGRTQGATVDFAPLVSKLRMGKQAQIEILYSQTGDQESQTTLTAIGKSTRASYRVHTFLGMHRLYLYTANCGFTPEKVTVDSTASGLRLLSVSVRPFPGGVPQTEYDLQQTGFEATNQEPPAPHTSPVPRPIPADFGAMISYREGWWRQPDFELFSWSLLPSVVVMEFRDLEVQSRFMTRLAYYVEKLGYSGELHTNRELKGLHGWNAHDYRPEDLARFFTQARRTGFELNPEEIELRRILLSTGLIVADSTGFRAGHGAIVSFAHTGSFYLRRILLTHEGYHGIFFTDPGYRERVFSIWDATSPEEQEIFRRFLRRNGYDVTDEFLVVNEFGAYLMQQPIEAVDSYFRTHLRGLSESDPSWVSSGLAGYFRDNPRLFRRSALEVQDAVRKAAGVDAGGLVSLELLD